MAHRWALRWIALASPSILIALLVGGRFAEWVFVLLVAGFPVALIGLGASRAGRLGPVGVVLAALAVLLVGGSAGVLLLSSAGDPTAGSADPARLPAATVVMLLALGLAPLLVVVVGYAATFRHAGPTDECIAAVRLSRIPSLNVSFETHPEMVLAALAYLVVLLAIGVWSARRTRTVKDFFIAGQRLGLVVTGLATMSAAFSGFVFLGGPGLTYRIGLASMFIVLPVGFTSGLLCWVLAKRLRLLAEVREVYTVPDAIACRYRGRSAAGLAALAVVLGSIAYLGLQIQALGVLLQSIFGLPSLPAAMGVGLLVLVLYSVAGGMIAGVYTDVIQGGLMLFAAGAVFLGALRAVGGWRDMIGSIAGSDTFGRAFLDPLGSTPVFGAFGFFFVFGVGVLGQPQMLHKFYMLEDPRKLKWMPLVLGSSQSLCILIWLGIGLAVPALVAQGAMDPPVRADEAAPAFLLSHVPPWLAGVAFAAILSAIMSTADSLVNIGSAALVHDLPRSLGRRLQHELYWGRAAILLIAGVAAVFAYAYGDLIALLGSFAFGIFGAALAPALALGLNWDRVTPQAASASIATGLIGSLVLELAAKQTWLEWLPRPPLPDGAQPAAISLAASFTVLLVVTWWTGSPSGDAIDDDVRAVMEA